jgi:hypothetical protein
MLTDFDLNTITNVTVASDYICRKILAEGDGNDRKRIAVEPMRSGRLGKRPRIDLQAAGLKMAETAARRSGSRWFGPLNWRQRAQK